MQVVDPFHFPNHTDAKCKKKYSPDFVRKDEEHKHWNMMCAEQTFVWLSRYKKMMCAMNKTHHKFFLHCIIIHRNGYSQRYHASGRKPLLPKPDKKRLKE